MKKVLLVSIVLVLPLTLLLMSCAGSEEEPEATSDMNEEEMTSPNLADLEWMLGTWVSGGGETVNYEEWMKVSDAEFTGRGYRVQGADTAITELLTLAATDSGTFYIAEVAHNAEATYFKMSGYNEMMVAFDNPEHDFPTRISYQMLTPDSVLVSVEGTNDQGEAGGFEIEFERMAN